MNNSNQTNYALKLLSDGFKDQLAEAILSNENFIELAHQITADFIDENIPLVEDDHKLELGLIMLDSLTIRPR